jgi:hypothetical protein
MEFALSDNDKSMLSHVVFLPYLCYNVMNIFLFRHV